MTSYEFLGIYASEGCQNGSVFKPVHGPRVLFDKARLMGDVASVPIVGAEYTIEHWHRLLVVRGAALSRLTDLVVLGYRFLRASRVLKNLIFPLFLLTLNRRQARTLRKVK